MFDGLDEVAPGDRVRVREAIEGLVKEFHASGDNRYLVTSRTAAYVEGTALAGFRKCAVLPLAPRERDTLIDRWYHAVLPGSKADRHVRDLCEQIAASDRRARDLAVTPLLATIFALVHRDRRELPKQRAEFFEHAVRILLTEPYKEEATADLERDWEARRNRLSYIAFTLHQWRERGDVVAEDELIGAIWGNFGADERRAREAARAFLRRAADRGGLLEEQDRNYGFYIHRTFQQFLAGRYLAEELSPEEQHAFLAKRLNDNHWDEPIRLAAGYLGIAGERRANDFILLLIKLGQGANGLKRGVVTAGLALADLPAARVHEPTRAEVEKGLIETLRDGGGVPARLRAEAGQALGLCGDPRPEVVTVDAMWFCLVPPGPFFMGSDDSDQEAFNTERPCHPNFDIPYGYAIGQYPVTNAQFQEFVKEGGYAEERWWAVARAHGVWKNGKVTRRIWLKEDKKWGYELEDAEEPADFGVPFNLPNHPVVGISWYEALAFTEWLSARWRAQGWLTDEMRVQLPSEPEWEKSARGGLRLPIEPVIGEIVNIKEAIRSFDPSTQRDNPEPRRRYPWGDAPDPNYANYDDTGITATSAAGCFWHPGVPYACQDLAGNVWEWTRSLWGPWTLQEGRIDAELRFPYPYDHRDGRQDLDAGPEVSRVLRGGAFGNVAGLLRCASRDLYGPVFRANFGFRVVVSPFFF